MALRSSAVLIGVGLLLAACGSRNFVIVVMDDVGVDRLSVYGRQPGQPRTPNIASFAAESAVFRAAYSQPSCTPTRAAIMTGRYGRSSGYGSSIPVWGAADEIPLEAVFLPEFLAGGSPPYESSAVGKWHMASVSSSSGLRHPLLQGFGWYAGAYGNLGKKGQRYSRFLKTVNGSEMVWTRRYATSDTVDDAIHRMNAMRPPWFLYVAFNAAHRPFHFAPGSERAHEIGGRTPRKRRAEAFNSMVEAIDREFGRLLAGIPASQVDRTTVFLLADNGTSTAVIRPPFDEDRSKRTVYEGGIHVPLMVRGPDVAAPGIGRDQLVHVVDLFPTIADLAGLEITHEIDGASFAPALRDPRAEGRDVVYSDQFWPNGPPPYTRSERAIRNRDWKLIRRTPPGGALPNEEFFAMRPGARDEGPNLLGSPLDPEARAAYETLAAALDRISARITYDGPASESGRETPAARR